MVFNNINKIKTFWKNIDSEYIENFVNKNKKSKLENHGDENYNNSNKMINTKINSGVYIDPNLKSEWNKYRQLVQKFTQRNKKILLNGWDGIDYYDGEVIKENFKHDRLSVDYPTIDHKISIFYGFKNGISAEEISNINNLCITKRYINSTKNYLNELEFKKNF